MVMCSHTLFLLLLCLTGAICGAPPSGQTLDLAVRGQIAKDPSERDATAPVLGARDDDYPPEKRSGETSNTPLEHRGEPPPFNDPRNLVAGRVNFIERFEYGAADGGGVTLQKRQTAAPFPPLVYSTNEGTGSVNPSLVEAASTAAEPYNTILASQGTNTATNMVPPFAPTTSRENTIMPLATTGTFQFTSGQPGQVLPTNTRPEYTATGTINLAATGTGAQTATSRAAAPSPLSVHAQHGLVVLATTFIVILSASSVGAILL